MGKWSRFRSRVSAFLRLVIETSAKAVKTLKNGMLMIEKNGKTYTVQGQLVK